MEPGSERAASEARTAIAYLAPEFGGLTSTFIYREVRELEQSGLRVALFSTTRPGGGRSAEVEDLVARTRYLYEAPKPAVLAAVARAAAAHPVRFVRSAAALAHDLAAARVTPASARPKLIWQFAVGALLAGRLRQEGCAHLHSHFAHVPTSIAMYAAMLAGIPYSFTAHANDLFERPAALREKVGRSAFAACISDYNVRHLTEAGCDPARLAVIHCGIDPDAYAFNPPADHPGPCRVLAVGRFVEKKGFDVLVQAMARLTEEGVGVRCRIIGGGPLHEAVAAQVAALHLEDCVELTGPMPQEAVKKALAEADVFALPCVVAQSGDRDGIPVVLMEAMALGVPVVSTRVSGIPELIEDGMSGLLAAPGNDQELANAIARLTSDSALRERLAREARGVIEQAFNIRLTAAQLRERFLRAARG